MFTKPFPILGNRGVTAGADFGCQIGRGAMRFCVRGLARSYRLPAPQLMRQRTGRTTFNQ
jgi:hypothetical protein